MVQQESERGAHENGAISIERRRRQGWEGLARAESVNAERSQRREDLLRREGRSGAKQEVNTRRFKWGQEVSRWAGCSKARCPRVKLVGVREWYGKLDE